MLSGKRKAMIISFEAQQKGSASDRISNRTQSERVWCTKPASIGGPARDGRPGGRPRTRRSVPQDGKISGQPTRYQVTTVPSRQTPVKNSGVTWLKLMFSMKGHIRHAAAVWPISESIPFGMICQLPLTLPLM